MEHKNNLTQNTDKKKIMQHYWQIMLLSGSDNIKHHPSFTAAEAGLGFSIFQGHFLFEEKLFFESNFLFPQIR